MDNFMNLYKCLMVLKQINEHDICIKTNENDEITSIEISTSLYKFTGLIEFLIEELKIQDCEFKDIEYSMGYGIFLVNILDIFLKIYNLKILNSESTETIIEMLRYVGKLEIESDGESEE